MATKLTSSQQATLSVLKTFPPKFDMIRRLIEEMASLQMDESQVRRLARMLDQMKIAAQSVGESAVADSLGVMAGLARRTGGLQTRVRGLREGMMGLRTNYDGAIRAASTPIAEEEEEPRDPAN